MRRAQKKPPLEEQLKTMGEILQGAFKDWRIFRLYETWHFKRENYQLLKEHRDFFAVSRATHFSSAFINAWKFLDGDPRTASSQSLLPAIKADKRFSLQDLQAVEDELDHLSRDVGKKITLLRNHRFGHQNNVEDIDAIFREAALTHSEFEQWLLRAHRFVETIAKEIGVQIVVLDDKAAESLRLLLVRAAISQNTQPGDEDPSDQKTT